MVAHRETSRETAYRRLIEQGIAEYDADRFEEARSLFQRAHDMNPNARTLRSLGMASYELRDYVGAIRYLSAALRDLRRPLLPEQRSDAEDLLERAKNFVDTYTIRLYPISARLTVDGREPQRELDGTVLLGFGTHLIEASAPGMLTVRRTVDVRGGSTKSLSLMLERPALAPPPRPARVMAIPPRVESTPPPEYEGGSGWLWGSAIATLAAGGSGYYWYRQENELTTCRGPGNGNRCTNESSLVTQRNIAIGATVGSGVLALTMAVVGGLSRHPVAPPPKVNQRGGLAFDCIPVIRGVSCKGVF
jgi:tetratricopeptide (TPR) repeat protein